MRVLALVTDGFGGFGGIARYNELFLRSLVDGEHVRQLTVLPRAGEPGQAPKDVVQWPSSAGKITYLRRLASLLLCDRDFDLVWCGHINMAPLAAFAARLLRCPWWLQIHGIDAWDKARGSTARAVRSAKIATAVSRFTRRRFLAWSDVTPERVRVLPNAVDPNFTPGPRPDYLLDRYNLYGRRIMLTVSRLAANERYKGHDRIIPLLPELRKSFSDLVYVIGGDGDDRPRLGALAENYGVSDICRFVGRISDEELVDHYRMADVFVMPSTGEGFGIVFLEAAASGVPAIGGSRDGSVDPLADGRIGEIVDPNGPEALLNVLVPTLRDRRRTDPESAGRFHVANFARHLANLVRGIAT